jgi:hypothetical protein
MTDLDSFSLQIKGEGIIKKELKDEILTDSNDESSG